MTTINAKTILEKSPDGRLDYKSEITKEIRSEMVNVLTKPDDSLEDPDVLLLEKLKALLEGVEALQKANETIGKELEELDKTQDNLELDVVSNRCNMIKKALDDCTNEEQYISEQYNLLLDHGGYLNGLLDDANTQGENANNALTQAQSIEKVIEEIIIKMNDKAGKIDSDRDKIIDVKDEDGEEWKEIEFLTPKQDEAKNTKESYTKQKEALNDKLTDVDTAKKNLNETKEKAENLQTTETFEPKRQEVLQEITKQDGKIEDNETAIKEIVEKYEDDAKFNQAFIKLEQSIKDFNDAKEQKRLEFNSDLTEGEQETLIKANNILSKSKDLLFYASRHSTDRDDIIKAFEENCEIIETFIKEDKVTEKTFEEVIGYKTFLGGSFLNEIINTTGKIEKYSKELDVQKEEMNQVGEIQKPTNDPNNYDDKDKTRIDAINKLETYKKGVREMHIDIPNDQKFVDRFHNIDWEALDGKIEAFKKERDERKKLRTQITSMKQNFNTNLGKKLDADKDDIEAAIKTVERTVNALPLDEFIEKNFDNDKYIDMGTDNIDEILKIVETSDTGVNIDFARYAGVLDPSNEDEKKLMILLELDNSGKTKDINCQFNPDLMPLRKLRNGKIKSMRSVKNQLGKDHFIVKIIEQDPAKFEKLNK